jgi:serine/threonine protein kinase
MSRYSDIPYFDILSAILEKVDNVIIKVGDKDTIEKEYEISKRLQKIDGFIKYYCYFSCNSEFREIDINKTLCYSEGNSTKIIVMEHYVLGSIGKFDWNKDNGILFQSLQSIIKQIIISLLVAFQTFGFIHNDTHLDNFLLDINKNKDTNVRYNNYTIPIYNYIVVIMDFENCLITDKYTEYYFLYSGFLQIITSLDYTLNLEILNISYLIKYIDTCRSNNTLIDIDTINKLIDNMQYIDKKIKPSKFTYNPNVYYTILYIFIHNVKK